MFLTRAFLAKTFVGSANLERIQANPSEYVQGVQVFEYVESFSSALLTSYCTSTAICQQKIKQIANLLKWLEKYQKNSTGCKIQFLRLDAIEAFQ
jgi:lipopolysaccharide biosynthesis regulator YciM